MVELVDTMDSSPIAFGRAGSTPAPGTCPQPGGCDSCPLPFRCVLLRIEIGLTTVEQEAKARPSHK
jgi:hypothetical protein